MDWFKLVKEGIELWDKNPGLDFPRTLELQYGFEWGTISALHLANLLSFHQKNELVALLNEKYRERNLKNSQEGRTL